MKHSVDIDMIIPYTKRKCKYKWYIFSFSFSCKSVSAAASSWVTGGSYAAKDAAQPQNFHAGW